MSQKKSVIEKYELKSDEIAAFNLAKIWIELCNSYFPDYQHTRLKSGDPRKSLIFKICYKLQRETKEILEEKDYNLYVRAQLEVLKFQSIKNKLVLIEPMCLVGEKAWKRWKLWQSRYKQKLKAPSVNNSLKYNQLGVIKAINGISKTKLFIEKSIGKTPTLKEYEDLKSSLLLWVNFGNISPYYVTLSPYMKKLFDAKDFKNFDIKVYSECITFEVEKLFKKLFYYENDTK